MTLTRLSRWLTSTKAITAQSPQKTSKRSIKWLQWLLKNCRWKSPGRKIN
jgi:hypothetical protein